MGLEIGIGWLTVLLFGSLVILLMSGLPLAFVTGGLGVLFLYLFGDAAMLNILPSRIFPFMTDYQLSAIPLFIFMAAMLERAGVIEELFDLVYKLLGGLRGGLAASTIIASTTLAAMVGVIGAAEVTMGIIALPAMLNATTIPSSRVALSWPAAPWAFSSHRRFWPSSSPWWPSNRLGSSSSARSFRVFCSPACISSTSPPVAI